MELKYLLATTIAILFCLVGSCRAQDDEDTETYINERTDTSTAGLYGVDVKLTQSQIQMIRMELQLRKTHSSFFGVQNAVGREDFFGRWENGVVPYMMDDSFNNRDLARSRIAQAIDLYEQNTCIRFVERTNQLDYVKFITGSGCYSYIGKIGGPQDISIGIGCESIGTVIHELFHALGRFHEQSRYDRDQFVSINRGNIRSMFESNFDIASEAISDLQGIPYDYGSVMHYSAYAFAVDRRTPTIMPIDGSVSLSDLGQRNGFSSSDITHARLLYCSNTITMGTWSQWSGYTTCSATCNGGTQVRTRTCQNGEACEGANLETRDCNTSPCAVEATWGAWSSWSTCSDSCGTGTRMRSRQCQNGNTCSGSDLEIEDCNTQACPIPATWGPWGSWGSCSRTCATGVQRRQRNCMNGNTCDGAAVDVRECNQDVPCTVDPSSGEWSQWTSCSATCGDGTRTRSRMCTSTNAMSNCENQQESCNEGNCINPKPTIGTTKYGCFAVPTFATQLRSFEDTVPELSDNPFRRIDPINKCGIAALGFGYKFFALTLGICISGSSNGFEYTRRQVPAFYCGDSNDIGGFYFGYFYMTVYEIVDDKSFSEAVNGEPLVQPSPSPSPSLDNFSGASFTFPSILVISFFLLISVFLISLNY